MLDGIFHAKLMTVMISLMFTVRIIRIVPSDSGPIYKVEYGFR